MNDKRPVGKPLAHPEEGAKKSYQIKVTKPLMDRIDNQAKAIGLSRSELADKLFRDYLGE